MHQTLQFCLAPTPSPERFPDRHACGQSGDQVVNAAGVASWLLLHDQLLLAVMTSHGPAPDRRACGRSGGQVQWLENPEINSSIVISSASISFRRLVGNIRRSEVIKSPLGVCSGDRVTGMNRRRCFSLFSTITSPTSSGLLLVVGLSIFFTLSRCFLQQKTPAHGRGLVINAAAPPLHQIY